MRKLYIGIDNGVSGTIGAVGAREYFSKTPVFRFRKYTVKESHLKRVSVPKMVKIIEELTKGIPLEDVEVWLERPSSGWGYKSSESSLRAWEATIIALESLGLVHHTVDSKKWQGLLLPKGTKGAALKVESKRVGNKLYPKFKNVRHPDQDGLLIAEYARIISEGA